MAKIIDAVLKLTDQFTPVLKNAQNAISQVSKQAIRAGKDIQKVGKNIEQTGKSLSVGVTAPLAAISVASIKTTMDFDASMSKVQALSGATAKQLEELRQKCIDLGGSTAWSASQVSEAMQYMSLAGWDSNAMLEGTKGIMDAASASGEDLASVCDIITDGLSAFNLTAQDSSRFADVLAKTAASSNTTIGMMGEAFTYAGSVAGAFNYSIEDTAVAIGLMANSGIKASNAGTALRKMLTEMQGTVEITGDKLGSYVIEVAKADGTMQPLRDTIMQMREAFSMLTDAEKAAQAEAIAGKTGMAGLLAIVNASDEAFNSLVNSIDNSTGAAAEMSEVMLNNLSGQVTIIKSGIESLAISIGTILTPVMSKIATHVQSVVTKFNNLGDEQKKQIVKWSGIAMAIGPALIIFGKIMKVVGKAVFMFGKFGKAIKGLTTMKAALAMIFTPANIVMLSIMGIALAAFLIIKYWEPIKAFFGVVFSKIKDGMTAMGFDFDKFKEQLSALKDHLVNAFNIVKAVLIAIAPFVAEMLSGIWLGIKSLFSGIVAFTGGLIGTVGSLVSNIMQVLNGIIDFIVGVFTGNWEKAWNGIKDIFFGVFNGIFDFFSGIIGTITSTVSNIVNTVKNGFKGAKVDVNVPDVPSVPAFAKGTNYFSGGLAQVNEKGGEIIDLPRGTRVIPHDKSIQQAKAEGIKQGSNTSRGFSIEKLADTIIVREESDIDKIANALYNKFRKQALNMA